jgi:hypothetical protein
MEFLAIKSTLKYGYDPEQLVLQIGISVPTSTCTSESEHFLMQIRSPESISNLSNDDDVSHDSFRTQLNVFVTESYLLISPMLH